MWSKLVEISQQPASKRLGIAIAISVLLHSIFFGNLNFSLPSFKPDTDLIEARLQTPKAVPVAESIAAPLPEISAEPPPDAPVESLPEPVIEQKAEAAIAAEATPVMMPELVPEPLSDNVDPTPIQPNKPEDSSSEELNQEGLNQKDLGQKDLDVLVNENAYRYIETEFDVRTAIDGSADGKATITYNVIENMQYRIRWLTEGNGIMALLFPELLQTSDGELTKAGLQPLQYRYQYGKKVDKTRSASFDWQAKKVILQTAKATKTEDLPEGTQDLLSFMYQFMHVAPLQHMQLPVVNGKKLRIYDYSFEGEEQVKSALGELKTVHILHSGSNEEEKTELWLAMDYQYVPVKIRKIESDGSVVEMVVTRITTDRDVSNQ